MVQLRPYPPDFGGFEVKDDYASWKSEFDAEVRKVYRDDFLPDRKLDRAAKRYFETGADPQESAQKEMIFDMWL